MGKERMKKEEKKERRIGRGNKEEWRLAKKMLRDAPFRPSQLQRVDGEVLKNLKNRGAAGYFQKPGGEIEGAKLERKKKEMQ